MNRIAIINPNTNGAITDMMLNLARVYAPELAMVGLTASRGPPLIASESDLSASADEVLHMARDLLEADVAIHGIIIGAIGDPGLSEVRKLTSVRVCGLADSAFREAARQDRPFAIVTTTPGLSQSLEALVRMRKLDRIFKGFAFARYDPALMGHDSPVLLNALIAGCNEARSSGAEVIIIGGGPLSQAAEQLGNRLDMPIIVPLKVAVADMLQR